MKVDIWSDIVCPWCYIGKRRFESALSEFKHQDNVEVTWHSFQLDPTAPKTSAETVSEHLVHKYGVSQEKAAEMNAHVSTLAAEEGLEYHLERAKFFNTFDAHRLIHLALKHDLQDQMKERLMRAYFTEGIEIGDSESLVRLAVEVGLDADEAREALDSNAYAQDVREDLQQAAAYGIQGVPFFVIDEKYGISGAQPAELFKSALDQAWAESHPLIKLSTATPGAAGSCEGDSCSI